MNRWKNGFTLIELMVVIVIMGILSALGVAGFQSAVENMRVRDASVNMAAFLERVAKESSRLSTSLCLKKDGTNVRKLNVYKGEDCSKLGDASPEFTFELDAPMNFADQCPNLGCGSGDCDKNWLAESNGVFVPKIGLSSAPLQGYVCMQFAKTDHYAVAVKSKHENFIRALDCDEEECD